MPYKPLAIIAGGRIHSAQLGQLLDQTASTKQRLHLRDAIAEHGLAALVAVRPWLFDRELSSFAVSVILRVAERGQKGEALATLRAARSDVPYFARAEVNAALRVLEPRTEERH